MFFSYTMRNLLARRTTVVPTMLAIIMTVAAIVIMQSLVAGLLATTRECGQPGNAVVLSQSAEADSNSSIGLPMVAKVATLPQVKDVSVESVVQYNFKRPDGSLRPVNVRGVDPVALKIHGVSLSQGQLPELHAPGCVVGARLVGRLPGFAPGDKIHIGHQDWPVTGVLNAPSTLFDSELWCDRTALMNELRTTDPSVLYVRLSAPDAQAPFANAVRAIKGQPLDAFPERVHFQRTSSSVDVYFTAVKAISAILALGAALACITALYLAFLGRLRELSTLVAIGYTRRRVAVIVLQETLILTLVSGAIGLGLGLLCDGRTFTMEQIGIIYKARVTPTVLISGAVVALVIGLVGAVASLIHTLRLRVMVGLRSL